MTGRDWLAVGWISGLTIAGLIAVQTCQPKAVIDLPAAGSDRVVAVTTAGQPAKTNAPVIAKFAVTPGRGVIAVTGNQQPVIVKQQTPGVTVSRKALNGKQTVVHRIAAGPVETALIAGSSDGSAMIVTSTPDPVEILISEPEPSRIGLIAGTFPGLIGVDVAVVKTRILGLGISLDVMASPMSAGVGVAVGDKVFGTAGGSVQWLGEPGKLGWYVAGGVRF